MKKTTRLTIQLLIAAALVITGVAMLICGLFMPPVGEIHSSVLVAYGEMSAFAGSLLGVDYHYRYKHHRDTLRSQGHNPDGGDTEI